MNAVVVLTKGYKHKKKYSDLIERNRYLEKFANKKNDYIIFHEGNINYKHQKYIQKYTPKLKLKFINVSNDFTTKQFDFYPPTKKWGLGYRNMCNFWFCNFWKYVEKYNKILRIDEDCLYFKDHSIVFDILEDKVARFGWRGTDEEYVTKGMNSFTLKFLKENGINALPKYPDGPYTNVIGLNLNLLRKNDLLHKYIKTIYLSNNIYIYRWGDLSLWGEVLHYLYSYNDYKLTKSIQYKRGSHGYIVGGDNRQLKLREKKKKEKLERQKCTK